VSESNTNESGIFEYGGSHFTPVRQFRRGEGDFHDVMRRVYTDRTVGLSTYDWQKAEYSYEGFYAASTDKQCDIFRCEETGRLYIPGANELFGYNERPQRSRGTKAKASVIGALEQAKADSKAVIPKQLDKSSERNGGDR